MATLSDLERIVDPIPAFLNAMAEWPSRPNLLRVWDDHFHEEHGELRACYQTHVHLLGGADTPLDIGIATLLRASRKGSTYSPRRPLEITIEAHVNARPDYEKDPIRFLLVFSSSRTASTASCLEHANRLLRYLVDPRNHRPLDAEERKMLGRMPVHTEG